MAQTLSDLLGEAATRLGLADDLPRGEVVYRLLLEVIQSGHSVSGQRVREEEIARVLGVSRSPVREALQRLQSKGLVESSGGRGLGITVMGRQQVIELYEMREALEGVAARLAAQHASDAELAMIRGLLEEFGDTADEAAALGEANRRLHQAIYDASHNRYVLQTLEGLNDAVALLGPTTLTAPGRHRAAFNEHRKIVLAIERRDPEQAERAARAHLQNAKEMRVRMLIRR